MPPEPGADPAVPGQIRAAAAVIGLESLALVVAAAVLIEKTIAGHPNSIWRALLGVAFALFGAVVLALGARGILRLRPPARTPIVVLQILAIPVAYSLAFQADLIAYGGPILVAALVTIYLLFTPPARAALDRQPY